MNDFNMQINTLTKDKLLLVGKQQLFAGFENSKSVLVQAGSAIKNQIQEIVDKKLEID
jgi:hypothetical protein